MSSFTLTHSEVEAFNKKTKNEELLERLKALEIKIKAEIKKEGKAEADFNLFSLDGAIPRTIGNKYNALAELSRKSLPELQEIVIIEAAKKGQVFSRETVKKIAKLLKELKI